MARNTDAGERAATVVNPAWFGRPSLARGSGFLHEALLAGSSTRGTEALAWAAVLESWLCSFVGGYALLSLPRVALHKVQAWTNRTS